MSIVQQVFQEHFPDLTTLQWLQVVTTCHPVLEVAGSSVELREEDMTRVATYLRVMHLDANSPLRMAYCSSAYHVSHKLNGASRRAEWALTQGAALPASDYQEAINLYRSVLESISSGDAIAQAISLAFAFQDPDRVPPRRVYPQATPTNLPEPSVAIPSPRNKRFVQDLPDQWAHLQAWFKQSKDPARPWSVSGIARQLNLNQSVVRALLTAPKGTPGCSRTAFSKAQLRLLQRYFKPYGYRFS